MRTVICAISLTLVTSACKSGGTSDTSAAGGAPTHAVINEISAKGDDWVELANPTDAEVDLGGYTLCDDVDPSAGSACDETTALRFPAGAVLPAGGHLLVLGNQDTTAGVGPSSACLADGGPSTCFHVSWKISASKGETVHLLDADGSAVDEARYPADAVPSGQTWGRLPDGRGALVANAPTPGAANEAASP
jgi:hypothetical protein